MSHAHPDHIGGLLDGSGRSAFPNAHIVIGRKEYDFWRHSGIRGRLGSGSVYGDSMVESLIGDCFDRFLLPVEQQLELANAEAEIVPGVVVVPAPGHTPGHIAFLVSTETGPLLFTADAFVLPEHVAHPEWTMPFDLDASQTIATRRLLLDRAATDDYRVAHYHVSGIGRIIRRGNGYDWQPEREIVSVG